MLYSKNKQSDDNYVTPIFGINKANCKIPKYKIGTHSITPHLAYRMIKDELMNEGNARLNLATFCQTYMESEATRLMAETLEKNAIDKSEYPQTTEFENRCVNILADLWNAPKNMNFLGTSTVGSSEACMLGGMSMKFRWRDNAKKLGIDISKQKPNIVISSGYQICWKKFCVYWDVEMRTIPMDEEHLSLDIDKVFDYVDEYTIGIVGILGITYTGKFDNIVKLDSAVEQYNTSHKNKIYIHVDAASGGLFTPFVDPNLRWDFRLKNVVSINASGHKYGLVYPGIGWILWKDQNYLPKELIFKVSYLGGEMPTLAINFSRSASQVIGQYYNFLRFGFEGFQKIHERTKDVALYISKELEKMNIFALYNKGENLPIVCYKLKKDNKRKWNLYDLSDRLSMKGWQIPAYPLPNNLNHIIIQRIVCRADLGYNLAELLINDFKNSIDDLNNAHLLFHEDENEKSYGFTH